MFYIYQPENFDCGSATGTFLVEIHRQILEKSRRFSFMRVYCYSQCYLIIYDIIIEFAEDLDG